MKVVTIQPYVLFWGGELSPSFFTEKIMGLCDKSNLEYEKDFFKWAENQAKFLKERNFKMIDTQNLIEEIECLGRSEKRALKNHLANLLMHLLKYVYQENERSRSWQLSIVNSRCECSEILSENPSLKTKFHEVLTSAYKKARIKASIETKLDISLFPLVCPWDEKQIFKDDFFGSK